MLFLHLIKIEINNGFRKKNIAFQNSPVAFLKLVKSHVKINLIVPDQKNPGFLII